jgi:hypothetical protein
MTASCRKVYHNCECAYINEYEEADTLLISVRAKNEKQASEECAKSELRIQEDEGFSVFCSLQR